MPFAGPITYETPEAFIDAWRARLPRNLWISDWKNGEDHGHEETDEEYEARMTKVKEKLLDRQTEIDPEWKPGMPIKVRLRDVEELTNYRFMPGNHGG